MACNTLLAITKGCSSNAGGIVKAWFGNGDAIDTDSVTTDIVDGSITAASLLTSADPFVEFSFQNDSCSYTENTVVDLTAGTSVYDQVITLFFPRREATKRQRLLLITSAQPELTVILKDSNGLYWIFGLDDKKVYLTGNEGGSGANLKEANGYTLTFTCTSATPAYEVDEAVIAGLIA